MMVINLYGPIAEQTYGWLIVVITIWSLFRFGSTAKPWGVAGMSMARAIQAPSRLQTWT